MEQSSAQDSLPGLPHGAPPQGSLPQEYWNSLDPIYTGQHSSSQPHHHPQQDSLSQHQQQQQPPLGIGWDHPVFQQQHQNQHQLQQRSNHLAPQTEQNHGIYSSIPQSWQPNPLHQPLESASAPQGYGAPSPYPAHSQVPHYPQEQMSYDSRSLTPSETSAFPAYSFPQNYFPSQHLSVQESFPQSPAQQTLESQHRQQPGYQATPAQYSIPSGYPQGLLNNPVDLTDDYRESEPRASEHRTINPQFLNTALQGSNLQHPSLSNNFIYVNPVDFERQNHRKLFNYYQADLAAQPPLGSVSGGAGPLLNPDGAKFPESQVVISAPKKITTKKQSQKKMAGTKATGKPKSRPPSYQESDTGSSDESDLEAPDEPSPIPPSRPTEPKAAVEFDTLQAVWSPRNKRPSADKVKGALVAFKDVTKALRDAWKEQVQAMKLAENQGDSDKAAKLKQDVALQRQMMDKIVTTALDMGHPMIVEKLGEHPMALAAIYSFLADRFQAADYEGALTLNMLKLLARFVTVDEDLLQKTNIAKLLPKFAKKGGQQVKDLTQKILDNAAASTKRKQSNDKPSKENSPTKSPLGDFASAEGPKSELAGSKRPREGEDNAQHGTKRMVVTSNTKDAGKPTAANNGQAKRAVQGAQNGKPAAAPAPRPKANIVAPKPTSLFGALSSAAKRPGTTNAERAAAAAAAKPTPVPEKKENMTPPPKPAFSFGDLMADLNKPKDSAATKPEEDRPPETEEERQKRLRKEARRQLHVTWKPDDCLTEVRLFTHDPEEELGPGDGSMRGAGDVKGEGRMLKLHKDLEELEEDDLGGIRETSFQDYHCPSKIEIDNEEVFKANFVKRGGPETPTSPEKEIQEHRESTTLMVFYTSPAEVPPSPKEPPAPNPDEIVPEEVSFGELPEQVKIRQDRYFAYLNPEPAAPAQPAPANGGGFDISNLLKLIQNVPQQQPAPQAPVPDLEQTVSMFRQQQGQSQAPQAPQVPVAQPQMPNIDLQKILSVMTAQQQMQQTSMAPQPQQSQPGMMPNLNALFSAFTGPNQQAGAQQEQPHGEEYEDPERKRLRESAQYDEQYDDRFSRQKRTRGPMSHPKAGSVACKFWREGKCRKGDNCTFRHDPF